MDRVKRIWYRATPASKWDADGVLYGRIYPPHTVTDLQPAVPGITHIPYLPIRGTDSDAGGVESAKIRNSRKNATNMFIPMRKEDN